MCLGALQQLSPRADAGRWIEFALHGDSTMMPGIHPTLATGCTDGTCRTCASDEMTLSSFYLWPRRFACQATERKACLLPESHVSLQLVVPRDGTKSLCIFECIAGMQEVLQSLLARKCKRGWSELGIHVL